MDPILPHVFTPTGQRYRHLPAEFCGYNRGWYQDGRRLRNVKTSKAFIWPKDGRNGSAWGRFKDILNDKGPDIYVNFNADKQGYLQNRPTRAQWAGHTHLDYNPTDSVLLGFKNLTPWTSNGMLGGRMPGLRYDFRTREYGVPSRRTWTDAVWQPEPRKNDRNPYPEALRDIGGNWYQDARYLPQFLGGPVNDELGRGIPGWHLGRWL